MEILDKENPGPISIFGKLKGKITILIIAHRLTTVMRADEIFEFKSGKVIHRGNFEELRKISKSFQDLSLLENKILKQ